MTVGDAFARAAEKLATAGVTTAQVDGEWLLAHVLGVSRSELALARGRVLTRAERGSLDALLERRARREPLAYVLGEWGFRRLTLRVDRRALVPRPETETVVERCLARLRGLAQPLVLDVGTGSGAIALAVADEHPGAVVTAFDSSPGAVQLARANAAATRLANRVRILEHDLSAGLPEGRYDVIVSNPPYIPADELEALEPEVRDWEPRQALVDGGATDAIARAARASLKPGGWLVLEAGDRRAGATAKRLGELGYADVVVSCDLGGRERVVEGQR